MENSQIETFCIVMSYRLIINYSINNNNKESLATYRGANDESIRTFIVNKGVVRGDDE